METTEPDIDHRKRALLIDDDESVRCALRDLLELLGFAADTAASGPAGLALFDQNRYDVVLTDLSMGGMSGWEVLAALRERDPRVPVVIVTGSAVRADDRRLTRPGVALVRKPVHLEVLEEVLARVLGESR